mmetsp:Transcript_26712/g.39308  ORF Transcript_26712/g.39308 Transcript_26712/m.39308 type:complete len:95 (+) Transcript_26712:180-464(+)
MNACFNVTKGQPERKRPNFPNNGQDQQLLPHSNIRAAWLDWVQGWSVEMPGDFEMDPSRWQHGRIVQGVALDSTSRGKQNGFDRPRTYLNVLYN